MSLPALLLVGLSAASPTVALLETTPGGEETTLRFQPVDGAELSPAAATLSHAPGSDVRGALLPDGKTVAAIAEPVRMRDSSWAGALYKLAAGKPAEQLAASVYASTRPLVSPTSGKVFVLRGSPGPEPTEDQAKAGQLRIDELRLEEIDPVSRRIRTLHATRGYLLLPLATDGASVFAYRVFPGGAEVLSVKVSDGSAKVLAPLEPFARDFFYDAKARRLVFTQATPTGWAVLAVGVDAPSAPKKLAEGGHSALVPVVFPDGRVAFHRPAGFAIDGAEPFAPGFFECRQLSKDGARLLCSHRSRRGALPTPRLIETSSHRVVEVPHAPGARVDLVGFVEASR